MIVNLNNIMEADPSRNPNGLMLRIHLWFRYDCNELYLVERESNNWRIRFENDDDALRFALHFAQEDIVINS